MKKFLLSTAFLLLILAVVSGQAYAAHVSINFAQGGNQNFSGSTALGPFATNSANWNNTNNFTTGAVAAGTMDDLKDGSGFLTGINLVWQSSGVGWNSDGTGDNEHKLSVGYLEDADAPDADGKGVLVTLTNIPYANYTVYGLCSSNAGDGIVNFDVNGTWALGGDATTTVATNTTINANMNANGEYWTLIEPGVTGNYWAVEASGATCTITGELQNDVKRGRLCGLVIVSSDEINQRSICVNYTASAFASGYEYSDEVRFSTNARVGYADPNGGIFVDTPIFQTPASTWNESTALFQQSGVPLKVKDQLGKLSSAYLLNNNNGNYFSQWLWNVDGLNGSVADLTGTPWELAHAKNKARAASGFIYKGASASRNTLTAIEKIPYSDYQVVAFVHMDYNGSTHEMQIEDQVYYYAAQNGSGFTTALQADPDEYTGWLFAADTVGPASQTANIAIFRDLSAPKMEIQLANGRNSGVNAFQVVSNTNADDIVTQIAPGNIDKNFGDQPVLVTSTLEWNAPVNGADSYQVYLGMYGHATDPNLYPIASTGTTAAPTLEYGTSYVWRVDTVKGAETISGDYFYFDTEGDPLLQVQPRSVSVEASTDTFLTVGALLTENYQWFYSADDVIGDDTEVQSGPEATLDVTNVTEGVNTGYYYVVLTNTISGSVPVTSATASLEIGKLELYLPFDGDPNDASGNEWDAVQGNRDDPAITATVSYQTGYDGIGQAVKFTRGSGDQLEVLGSDDYFNFYPKGFTVRLWVKPDSYDDLDGYMTFVSKHSGGWRMYDEAFYDTQGFNAAMYPVGNVGAANSRLDDGNWHMIACTYDGATQEMKVYQEGFLRATHTVSLNVPTSYPITIGSYYKRGTGGWGYQGLIDDVEIFSYAISEYDILDDYAGKTGLEYCFKENPGDVDGDCQVGMSDLAIVTEEWLDSTDPETATPAELDSRVVSWQFDETSGMVAADSSGNGIDGTLGAGFTTGQWIVDGGRTGATGDNALYMDGSADTSVIATVADPNALPAGNVFKGTAEWTMNIWVKLFTAEMNNIGGFGRNEWLADAEGNNLSVDSDRYFASWDGGLEVELGVTGLFPGTSMGAEWSMLTATYDGTTCTVYVNGAQVSQMDVALVDTVAEEINLNTARRVLWSGVDATVPMNAHVDDFSIWGEAFNAAHVAGMYTNSFVSCDGAIDSDLNGDCEVDLYDFAIMAADWLECNLVPSSLCD